MKITCFMNEDTYNLSILSQSKGEAQMLANIMTNLKHSNVLKPQISMGSSGDGYKNIELNCLNITKISYDEIEDLCLPGLPVSYTDFQEKAREHGQALKEKGKKCIEELCNKAPQVSVKSSSDGLQI